MSSSQRGQFDAHVDGASARKGGLIAKLTKRPWPSQDEVHEAVRAAQKD